MAKTKTKNVILLLRDHSEDDYLKEIWNSISLLRDSYIRHVYANRQRTRNKRENKKTVTSIPNKSVDSSSNDLKGKDLVEVVIAPPPPVTSISIPVPTPVPKPLVLSTEQVAPGPSVAEKAPSPPMAPAPVKIGPLKDSPVVSKTPPPSVVLKMQGPPAQSSLIDLSVSPRSFKDAVTGTAKVSKTVSTKPSPIPSPELSPSPPPKPPSRVERKLQADPERRKWIKKRRELEERGADLQSINLGRADRKDWMPGGFKNLYVVWKGVRCGVFYGWDLTKSLVSGYKGACYKKVPNEREAINMLIDNL